MDLVTIWWTFLSSFLLASADGVTTLSSFHCPKNCLKILLVHPESASMCLLGSQDQKSTVYIFIRFFSCKHLDCISLSPASPRSSPCPSHRSSYSLSLFLSLSLRNKSKIKPPTKSNTSKLKKTNKQKKKKKEIKGKKELLYKTNMINTEKKVKKKVAKEKKKLSKKEWMRRRIWETRLR